MNESDEKPNNQAIFDETGVRVGITRNRGIPKFVVLGVVGSAVRYVTTSWQPLSPRKRMWLCCGDLLRPGSL